MHKVSSENRTQSIKRVAEQISQWNDLQSDVWRLCRKCFVSFSVYNTIFA
jgi:hypothetical protein